MLSIFINLRIGLVVQFLPSRFQWQIYLAAIRQIIKELPGNLSHVNECPIMPSVNNVTKSNCQINKTQDFPNFSTILCAGLQFSFFFVSTRFLIKRERYSTFKCVIIKNNMQVQTKRCLFKVTFVKYRCLIFANFDFTIVNFLFFRQHYRQLHVQS